MTLVGLARRLSGGVELHGDKAHARVWAPACRRVDVVIDAPPGQVSVSLDREPDGFFGGTLAARAGDRYWFRLDGGPLRPDPYSRCQPDGPHGASQIVDPTRFSWTDAPWKGIGPEGHVIYELHVGTFTSEGTWTAATAYLPELAGLGITVIEMMPIGDFSGRFGWGYDGVNLYAPTRLYGRPDDLRAFIDRAHALGIGVILDVVYNHLGPDGNYLGEFSPDYFTDKYTNDWGKALNFEGPVPAREFFVENAGYWIDEYHFDGLRLDATQDVHDASAEHVLTAIARRAREAAGRRSVYVIGENEPQNTRLVRPTGGGGYGLDALWNDDFHHTAVVALTGRREAYYTDYQGTPQELLSCAKYGFLYQGQWYKWQQQRRGTPSLDLPHTAFVAFLENHDQVANSAFGSRLHRLAAPARLRALTALLLLGPATPLLFQGQEFSSSAPFLYFADVPEDLRTPVSNGRREFLSQFASVRDPEVSERLATPSDESTFRRSTVDHRERERHTEAYALHADLIHLRHSDDVIGDPAVRVDGAVLTPHAFVLRYFGGVAGDRLLVVNLGRDVDLTPAPEPLLAPLVNHGWGLVWSSESVRYGGRGTAAMNPHEEWRIPAECAVLFRSHQGWTKDGDDDRNVDAGD